jgi:hypothetical protein
VCVINTPLVANRDGDWSRANRFFPLHQGQLGVVARVVGATTAPAVVCGDFNVDRDSVLLQGFLSETGWPMPSAGSARRRSTLSTSTLRSPRTASTSSCSHL